jgi:oligopeptide/dipeptide ABC transporter ATP-binding protein
VAATDTARAGDDAVHTGPALAVEGLTVGVRRRKAINAAVEDVSFTVERGEIVCLVGESGCGKTMTALAVMGLLPPAAHVAAGRILLDGEDLLRLSKGEMRRRRGRAVSMVFQEPMTALDPSFTIGSQLVEAIRAHTSDGKGQARARAIEMLDLVGIPNAQRRLDDYPHQFSGGMRQRVVIAMALLLEPRVLIADEPTTALDVTIQAQILELIVRLRDELGMSVLLITHDLGVVNEIADRVVVMYAGEVVEGAPAARLFDDPLHPYSQGLMRSMPELATPGERLPVIVGRVPDLGAMPPACRFAPRCPNRIPKCDEQHPPLAPTDGSRELRCYNPTPLARQ